MSSGDFFTALPVLDGFARIADPHGYAPLPDDWMIGVTDVVSSTEAILQGRYKAVNTAGAAVISAVSNALGTLDFPYVFTGDGMCYAVPPDQAAAARDALAATINWVGSEIGLTLRGGEISVGALRAAGRDVRVARFAPSPDVVYAMFSGGGLAWAEDQLKQGTLSAIAPRPDLHPDLAGLSCRFQPMKARNGLMLSLIVSPRDDRPGPRFEALVDSIVATIAARHDTARPIPASRLRLGWPPAGFANEARLHRRPGQHLLVRQGMLAVRTLGFAAIMWAGRRLGSFSPQRYFSQLAENADDRKFEDRLMMTVDCSAEAADRIEATLTDARAQGIADFGLHRQESALITCVVPSPTRPDHVHFIDGASGGYALAALALKRSLPARNGAARALAPEAIP